MSISKKEPCLDLKNLFASMQYEVMEKISQRLELIMHVINPEDAYYINDVIITSLHDPDMPTLVQEILDYNGYEDEIMKQVLGIVLEVQQIAADDGEEQENA